MPTTHPDKRNLLFRNYVKVRPATTGDVNAIYTIAASVGTSEKDSSQGFLVDDYEASPSYYMDRFADLANRLDHFYVAENVSGVHKSHVVGFLIAYTRPQWLEENPDWIQDVSWHPQFDQHLLKRFVLVDKTAIRAHLTGHGIGSALYQRLIDDLLAREITTMFGETIISPVPNFASLAFRKKQAYQLAGIRYEPYQGQVYTNLVYYKDLSAHFRHESA